MLYLSPALRPLISVKLYQPWELSSKRRRHWGQESCRSILLIGVSGPQPLTPLSILECKPRGLLADYGAVFD